MSKRHILLLKAGMPQSSGICVGGCINGKNLRRNELGHAHMQETHEYLHWICVRSLDYVGKHLIYPEGTDFFDGEVVAGAEAETVLHEYAHIITQAGHYEYEFEKQIHEFGIHSQRCYKRIKKYETRENVKYVISHYELNCYFKKMERQR